MRTLTISLSCILWVAAGAGDVRGASSDDSAANNTLLGDYPGVRIYTNGADVRAIYGKAMTSSDSPQQAAQWWLDDYSAALGVAHLDLRLVRSNAVNPGQTFTVFAYQQYLDGLPVEFGQGRILVRNGVPNRVVYVSAQLAHAPEAGYPEDVIRDGVTAMASVQAMERFAHLSEWTEPELVVIYGEYLGESETAPSIRAWEFQGTYPVLSEFERCSFFVNAADGKLAHVRNDVYNTDVEGHVSGVATPGTSPDSATNPPVDVDMEDVLARIPGGESTHSDENGDFVIPNAGDDLVTIRVDPDGNWVNVDNDTGANILASLDVTPPGPAVLQLNSAPIEETTSQVNAHIHTTLVHDFWKDRQPDFFELDLPITANVNINSICNAFFSGLTINFYSSQSPTGCPNTAYSTVVAHEYGHFVIASYNLSQGAFGEGFGDAIGVMLYDDPVTARDFFAPGDDLRNAEDVEPYPCSGAIHDCGVTLSGVWWEIRNGFGDLMGSDEGLAHTQQLFTDWMSITNGGAGSDSAHPLTAIEVLTLDDDDDDLENGTPNFFLICDAFGSRNIPCPELTLLTFEYPDGRPEVLAPNVENFIRVNVVADSLDPEPGTGTVSYSIDGGEFTTVAMTELAPNEYEATLPATECLLNITYYFTSEATGGAVVNDPPEAPASTFSVFTATGTAVSIGHDFEDDPGWVVSGNATLGQWERAVPAGNGGELGDPLTDFDGSGQCFVTGNGAGQNVGNGATLLTSIDYDLTTLVDPQVGYARWYSNSAGPAPEADVFIVKVSGDGGSSWVSLEVVGPGGDEVNGGWFVKTFRIADYVEITDQFRVRFAAADTGTNSIIEAAIDAFEIFDYVCEVGACEGDANGDSVVDPLDTGFVLSRFGCSVGAGDPDCDSADQNGDLYVDSLDVGYILSRFGECE